MTVQELIALLEKIKDKEKKVLIAVSVYTKAYPIAYCKPCNSDYLFQNSYEVRLNISLPSNMHVVSKRKV